MRYRISAAIVAASLLLTVGSTAAATAAASTATIAVSASSGPANSVVGVTGTAFPARTKGTLTAGASIARFTTTSAGSFSSSIAIPAGSSGTIVITAKAGKATATATFSVNSDVTVSSAALRFGVSTPGGALANGELDSLSTTVGEKPSIVLWYKDFASAPPIAELDSVHARGATSLLTWEPWLWGGGVSQPALANARIAAGDFDPYIREWGAALASWGKPVMLRYGHEMNGDWYPWADGVNGNASGSFVEAWRHVHEIVASEGASNVQWMWSPNIPYDARSSDFASLYPGAEFVDVAALDGYNWGTSTTWSSWTSPSALFGAGLASLREIAPGKPIIIAETASTEVGGSKAEWNAALVSYLAAQSDVTGFVWFNHNKETDWRLDSSVASAEAIKSALNARG